MGVVEGGGGGGGGDWGWWRVVEGGGVRCWVESGGLWKVEMVEGGG